MLREDTSGCSNKPLKFSSNLGHQRERCVGGYEASARIRRKSCQTDTKRILSSFGKHFPCTGGAATSLHLNLVTPDEDKERKAGNGVDLRFE